MLNAIWSDQSGVKQHDNPLTGLEEAETVAAGQWKHSQEAVWSDIIS